MSITKAWLARITAKIRTLFAAADAAIAIVPSAEVVASPLPTAPIRIIEIIAEVVQPAAPRLLAAQLASQAKLNVPVGKKPRTAKVVPARTAARRPKVVAEVKKKTATPRSVYLPARHIAAKAKPKPQSNVVILPIAARSNRTSKPIAVKPQRIAA